MRLPFDYKEAVTGLRCGRRTCVYPRMCGIFIVVRNFMLCFSDTDSMTLRLTLPKGPLVHHPFWVFLIPSMLVV